MPNALNNRSTPQEDWVRRCADRRLSEPREWSVATQGEFATDDLSGARVSGGLRQQPQQVALSGSMGTLRIEGDSVARAISLAVGGPFAVGVAVGPQSGNSPYIEVQADKALLDKIELLVDSEGKAQARFKSDASWDGLAPKLTAVLPQANSVTLLTNAEAGVGAFGPMQSLALNVGGVSSLQVSLPIPGFIRHLSVGATGDGRVRASSAATEGERWRAQEGTVAAVNKARVDLKGVAFDRASFTARNEGKIQRAQATVPTFTVTGLAVAEGSGPNGPWAITAEKPAQAPGVSNPAPSRRPAFA